MGEFGYLAPTSVDEALSALADAASVGQRAQMLAGGTDVLVQIRSIDKGPRTFVDVKHVQEANVLSISEHEVFVGAAIASAVLNENARLKSVLPGLVEAADLIGSTQIQGRATIGGNLCNSSPAGDTIPALIACGAVCVIASPGGNKAVPVEDFVTGVGTNVLEPTEFLVGFKIPRPKGRTSDAYLRFIPRTEMDIAVCGAGVALTLDDEGTCTAAKVAIGAVAVTALPVPDAAAALIGTTVDDVALAAAAAASTALAKPITDKRGTVAFRKKVVGVLTKRAAAIARDRALAL